MSWSRCLLIFCVVLVEQLSKPNSRAQNVLVAVTGYTVIAFQWLKRFLTSRESRTIILLFFFCCWLYSHFEDQTSTTSMQPWKHNHFSSLESSSSSYSSFFFLWHLSFWNNSVYLLCPVAVLFEYILISTHCHVDCRSVKRQSVSTINWLKLPNFENSYAICMAKWCLHPVWILTAVIWFHFSISSLLFLPTLSCCSFCLVFSFY